jgi:hypothetical protein
LDSKLKYSPEDHWNPKLYVLNCLGELKQQIWFNQYSISDYEKQEKETRERSSMSTENQVHNNNNNINNEPSSHNMLSNACNRFAAIDLFDENENKCVNENNKNNNENNNSNSIERANVKVQETCLSQTSERTGSVIVERRRISGQFWQTLDLKSFPAVSS